MNSTCMLIAFNISEVSETTIRGHEYYSRFNVKGTGDNMNTHFKTHLMKYIVGAVTTVGAAALSYYGIDPDAVMAAINSLYTP